MGGLTFDSVQAGDLLPEVVRSVDQETFWKFAVASFDYNPVHCDPAWVETARPFTLTTTVGHGMMTAAFMSTVVTRWMLPTVLRIRRASVKLTFPVLAGWTVTCRGHVAEKHVLAPGRNFVRIVVEARNQDDLVLGVADYEVEFPEEQAPARAPRPGIVAPVAAPAARASRAGARHEDLEKHFRTDKHPAFSTDFFADAEDYEVWEEIDFADLREVEGERTFTITAEDAKFFAEAALDDHPMLRDEQAAARSSYGELFVHPLFMTSIIFWCIGAKGRGNWIRTPGARNPGQSCVLHEYLRIGETIHVKMKPHDRYIKRGKYYLVYAVDLYDQDDVLKVETLTTLILPKDREGIRKFMSGERGVTD